MSYPEHLLYLADTDGTIRILKGEETRREGYVMSLHLNKKELIHGDLGQFHHLPEQKPYILIKLSSDRDREVRL